MNALLTNPHLIRGAIVGVPLFVGSCFFYYKEDDVIKNAAKVALIGAVAVAAFSAIAATFGALGVGVALGASLGGVLGYAANKNSFSSDKRNATILGAVFGGVAGALTILFFDALGGLGGMEIKGYAFVNGQFVPVFGAI